MTSDNASQNLKIAVIVGSTRPGNLGTSVGNWTFEQLKQIEGAEWDLLSLADYDLDLLNEPMIPGAANRNYENAKTTAWGKKVDDYDAYVFVTPEYNHGVPGAFKNAFDVISPEWRYKAVGFVAYGADGGTRAVEQWRVIVANAYMFDVRPQVALSLFTDMGENGFTPLERRAGEVKVLGDELVKVANATASLR